MNITNLRTMVQFSESMYEHVDKHCVLKLTEFLSTFNQIYDLFQTRETYQSNNAEVTPELKVLFDNNDSELTLLARKVYRLADAIDNEFEKFRKPKSPSLAANFSSFFEPVNSKGEVSSNSIYQKGMSQTSRNSLVTLESMLIKYKTKDTNIALRRAAHQGNITHVELLISHFDADINSKSSNGFSALDWAFFNNKMEPNGVFNTLCWLGADQSLLKPLLSQYVLDDESEYPTKDITLVRALRKGNESDVNILTNKYKADLDKAQNIIDSEAELTPTLASMNL